MITTHVSQIKKGTFGRQDIMQKIYYRRNFVTKEMKEATLKKSEMTTRKSSSRNRV
jgi:hypothetical protein